MILIITHKEDYTADFVIHKLNQKKIPYYRFNCEDCLKDRFSLRFGKNLQLDSTQNRFSSVWYRRIKLPEIESDSLEEKGFLLGEIDSYLSNLFGVLEAEKWLSKPIQLIRSENKFLQLKLAKKLGLDIPPTLISCKKEEILEFYNEHKQIVIKPIHRARIDYLDNTSKLLFTNIINSEMINGIDQYLLIPSIYQAYIEKEYELRVTIVDQEVFAAKVDSQKNINSKVDWRREKLRFEKYDLPVELSSKCVQLLNELGVSFGAFDFIKGADQKYYFLDANPNGQWVWIEKETQLPISEAIINFLSK